MYRPKLEKDIRCPLEYGLDLFGGKWKSRILCVLAAQKELRYSVLSREMSNITDAVLATTLRSSRTADWWPAASSTRSRPGWSTS